MGTGIVSIGLSLAGAEALSRGLLGVAIALWLGLVAALTHRALSNRQRLLEEARRPAALTLVAGTVVVGARFARLGVHPVAYALLAAAALLWLVLLGPVLRKWATPTAGVSFLLAVATESLAVLSALLASEVRVAWLAIAALVLLVAGLAAYAFVLARLDPRHLLTGRGDHWIAGGALAIAALACARTTAALATVSTLPGLHAALDIASLALWAAAAAWLLPLLACELVAPRLAFDSQRWSTVFPLGMYSVCSVAVGNLDGVRGVAGFGTASIWVALAVWALVLLGTLRRARGLLTRRPRPA
jgi:tellurite resistance protein TehA-like permease